MWWIFITLVIVALTYFIIIKPLRYWTDKGVKQGCPLPIIGDNWDTVTNKTSYTEFSQIIYNRHPNSRYSGIYEFFVPMLLIRDPDLIKQITVKDFDHFVDRRFMISPDADPLFGNNLFSLRGQKWRDMRATLSPAYTGSKMKQMFGLVCEATEQFVDYFLKQDEQVITVEMKDVFSKFANDVIASTAFGIKCNSLDHPENEFYLMGKKASNFRGFWKIVKYFGRLLCPKLYVALKIPYFPAEVGNFFRQVVAQTIENRQNCGTVRPDMIHLLMEARRNGLKHDEIPPSQDDGFAISPEAVVTNTTRTREKEITNLDITAQALMFYFAGFTSSASLMAFMAYEIAVNPNVQDRLVREIDTASDQCGGKLTYEMLLKLKYLDMVTSETLRKWPFAVTLDRVCTKPYTIEPKLPGESPVYLQQGDLILLPMYGIHRDPKYYPEPERFDPERFNDENKHQIHPGAFFAFGCGPRSCIASRFALLETKAVFFYLLRSFEIVPVEKTAIPLTMKKKDLSLAAEGGVWLGLKRRNNS